MMELEPARRHFIDGIATLKAQRGFTSVDTLGQQQEMKPINFDPLDITFLLTASEECFELIVALCAAARLSPILRIPAELRLQIYDYAIEDYWNSHPRHTRNSKREPWRRSRYDASEAANGQQDRPEAEEERLLFSTLEPPILRTCKLFRKEASDSYDAFLRAEINNKQPDRLRAPNRDLKVHCIDATVARGKRMPVAPFHDVATPRVESAIVELRRLGKLGPDEAQKEYEDIVQADEQREAGLQSAAKEARQIISLRVAACVEQYRSLAATWNTFLLQSPTIPQNPAHQRATLKKRSQGRQVIGGKHGKKPKGRKARAIKI